MQTVEEFMREFLRARAEEEQRLQIACALFRQAYFTVGCEWDSRTGTLEMIQSEALSGATESDSEATVVTEYENPFYPSGPRVHRHRYHLIRTGGRWLIARVELECPMCEGRGDKRCRFCDGNHWR